MKCIVYYEIDGKSDLFTVEDRNTEKCRLMLNSEIERLGLTDEKNNVKIDAVFENKRSAWFCGIPCWYFVDTEDLRGRTLSCDILFITALGLTSLLSRVSRWFTGRGIDFPIKVREIE